MFVLNSGFKLDVDTNSKMKSIFIMNFAKLIEWPESYRQGDFVVGVVGNTPLYPELIKMAKVKKVSNQSLRIKKFELVEDIGRCHVLYLSEEKSSEIASVVSKVKPNSTLIITAKQGLVDKGAGINFIIKNNRQKFEINKRNLESSQLKISSSLESLAFSVK
jgi:hypothetical protein